MNYTGQSVQTMSNWEPWNEVKKKERGKFSFHRNQDDFKFFGPGRFHFFRIDSLEMTILF
jgi:hypothetical protein